MAEQLETNKEAISNKEIERILKLLNKQRIISGIFLTPDKEESETDGEI